MISQAVKSCTIATKTSMIEAISLTVILYCISLLSCIYSTAQLQGNECSRVAREFHACRSRVSCVSLASITCVARTYDVSLTRISRVTRV